ncbi:hypothetical protein HPT27_06020 [Permianibacter sp. IMCC34836]|uniref:hypothetical protein n=1 Tax=Permianibacter fluminis TaxID=2738515 RepID=UPI00155375A0|nr:hypothetical protein [Permianibacter fluminis]NQD36573.1 hypothetical protein [Permianibacter fluminis]
MSGIGWWSRLVAVAVLTLLSACGGGGSGGGEDSAGNGGGIVVTVNPGTAALSVGSSQQFSATVTGSNNSAVSWTATAGSISSNGMFTAPAQPGTVTITATSVADASRHGSATVTVTSTTPIITVTVAPAALALSGGATQQFTATVSGTGNTAVNWTVTAGTITSNGLFTAPGQTGTVIVTATSVADPQRSGSATVTVNGAAAPQILAQPAAVSVLAGQTASFQVVAQGSNLSYQWRRNGATLNAATSPHYVTAAVSNADDGSMYSVTVSNSSGSVTSAAARLSVVSGLLPPSISKQPVDRTVTVGNVVEFSVTAEGPALQYQWRRNGNAIAGATAASYLLTPVQADDNARFDVVVSNSIGILYSDTALLRVNPVQSRTPVSGHPRLWLRAADLPTLRSWATSSNPMYQDGLLQLANTALQRIESGALATMDNGGSTYTPAATEAYAALMALMSLIDVDANRNPRWVAAGKNALFQVIDQAYLGVGSGRFRSDAFSASDRGRWHGVAFPLTVDWLYPHLTADEKRRIRRVFLRWAAENRDGYPSVTYYNEHVEDVPVGNARRNHPALLDFQDPKRRAIRYAANNYLMAHARNIFMMANVIDPADDVAEAGVSGDSAGKLGDFMHEAIGTHLYMTDYMYRNDGFGGISPEGAEYGGSLGFYYGMMLALHTSGMDDTTLYGDKVSLRNHPLFSRLLPGFFHSLSTRKVHTDYGDVYQPAWFGDGEQVYLQDDIDVLAPFGLYARYNGNSADLNAAKWFQYYAPPDNPARLTAKADHDDDIMASILYFLLFEPGQPGNPNAAPPADPRPAYASHFFAPSLGRLQARTSWNDNADVRLFNYKLSWNSIDHQHGDGNMFDFWRKGEWLTKELTAYGAGAASSEYKNTLTIQNDPAAPVSDYHQRFLARGSQYIGGAHAGDPKVLAEVVSDDYAFVTGDATNLYNYADVDGNRASDVSHASRSLFWLKPDVFVVLDRAETRTDNRFKRFWLNLPSNGNAPQRTGSLTTAITPNGQRLFVTTLLPSGSAASASIEGPALNPPDGFWQATLDPMAANKSNGTGGYRLRVEATGQPRRALFLHVLEGADAAVAAKSASVVQSDNGNEYVGAVVGQQAVLMPAQLGLPFTGTHFVVAGTVTRIYLTGLLPGSSYSITEQSSAGGRTITVSIGGALVADAGGVLQIP